MDSSDSGAAEGPGVGLGGGKNRELLTLRCPEFKGNYF